jgi:uncharacterized protein with LGFP repeats
MRLVALRRRSRAVAVLAGLVLAVLLPQGTASAADPITTAWTASGGASGPLGAVTGDEDCSSLPDAGCMQTFAHGTFYWSAATLAHWVPAGPIAAAWAATGGVSGGLGWPWRNPICDAGGGCRQLFQQGWIADSPSTGTHLVPYFAPFGSPRPSVSLGGWWSFGQLGYPTGDVDCALVESGCRQSFERGSLYAVPGYNAVPMLAGPVTAYWTSAGAEQSAAGFPTGPYACDASGSNCWQRFERGTYLASSAGQVHAVPGALGAAWGGQYGPIPGLLNTVPAIGMPVAEATCYAGLGCEQYFTQGTLVSYGNNAVTSMHGAIATYYDAVGGLHSSLIAPRSEQYATAAGGTSQYFWGSYGGAEVHWSPATGAHAVLTPITTAYDPLMGASGALGYPVAEQYPTVGGGVAQPFQHGGIHWSPVTGGYAVLGAIAQRYDATRAESGALGYPVGAQFCGLRSGGCGQHFHGGSIYWSSATGAHPVSGAIRGTWAARGSETSALGYPTSDMSCGLRSGGCGQHFQGGSIYWSSATGAHPVSGAIRGTWAARGSEAGALGYPTSDMFCGLRYGGCGQHFQGGSIYWSPGTGAHVVTNPIRAYWAARFWEGGPLGYPTSDMYPWTGGHRQNFQGGVLFWNARTGAVSRV